MSRPKGLSVDEVAAIVASLPSFRPGPGCMPGEGTADYAELIAAGFVPEHGDPDCLVWPDAGKTSER